MTHPQWLLRFTGGSGSTLVTVACGCGTLAGDCGAAGCCCGDTDGNGAGLAALITEGPGAPHLGLAFTSLVSGKPNSGCGSDDCIRCRQLCWRWPPSCSITNERGLDAIPVTTAGFHTFPCWKCTTSPGFNCGSGSSRACLSYFFSEWFVGPQALHEHTRLLSIWPGEYFRPIVNVTTIFHCLFQEVF